MACTWTTQKQMTETEPEGHRGHPTSGEECRARALGQRLGALVAHLQDHGFLEQEAIAFVAGAAHEIARERGESWGSVQNAKLTVANLLLGRAAKTWSLDAITLAITSVDDLLEEGR